MQAVREFGRQKRVNQPVAGDPIEARESIRNNPHPVMRPPSRTGPCMPDVSIGFVDDLEEHGIEPPGQTRDDSFLHVHGSLSRDRIFDIK